MNPSSLPLTALLLFCGALIGAFFLSFGRAAIAGVVLATIVSAALVAVLLGGGPGLPNPAYAIGNIFGRTLVGSVLGALLGCAIRRVVAWLFGGSSSRR